jgi:DNA-binding SARP family transcriptional activator
MRPPRIRALPRERLLERVVARTDGERLVLVSAPAGSGKTTLLAQLAASHRPTAWYLVEGSDAEPSVLLRHLEHAASLAMPGLLSRWTSAERAARALEGWSGPPALMILDELEVLHGSASEQVIEELVEISPPGVTFLIASRSAPGFNLSRLRVSGLLTEITEDDLRFRSWEVERLFRGLYGEQMVPEDILLLTRRVHGWAAGLRLFHLATQGKSASQRHRILGSLGTRPTLVQEYLARNVIDELPETLREFLLQVSVLEQPTEALCDDLLGRRGNRPVLKELERRQLLTPVSSAGAYRCHATLRAYLEDVLVDELGEAAAHERYRRAARLLEASGLPSQALRAYCRAADWGSVKRLLGRSGRRLADDTRSLDEIPGHILSQDPWLRVALARRYQAMGRLDEAIRQYGEAEQEFGHVPASRTARKERLTLSAWLTPAAVPSAHWSAPLKVATMRDPIGSMHPAAGPQGAERSLVIGLAALLAGDVSRSLADLRAGAPDADPAPPLAIACSLSEGVASLLAGEAFGAEITEGAADEAERLDVPWLARLGRAVLALSGRPDAVSEAAVARTAFERCGDPWGAGLAGLLEGWGRLRAGLPAVEPLRGAAGHFAGLGAGVLETWAGAALSLAMARAHEDGARELAARALETCRREKLRGVAAIAHLALAETADDDGERSRLMALRLARDCGLALPTPAQAAGRGASSPGDTHASGTTRRAAEPPPSVAVHCLGGFEIVVHGVPVDLATLRPRQRQALRMLALHAGRPVHREVLAGALWPDVGRDTAIRNVHVAISSLRHALERAGSGKAAIVRDEEAYRLALPPDGWMDLVVFERSIEEGRRARAADDLDRAIEVYGRALNGYRELLPEDGPAEWVLGERDRFEAEALEATKALVEIHLERGEAASAATVSERWLRLDPYQDDLWRLRIAACERAGNLAAAERARRDYRRVLTDLGVVDLEDPSSAAGAYPWRTAGEAVGV